MLDAFEAQVLEIDDATPLELTSGETPETAAPAETPATETADHAPPLTPTAEKADTLPAQKPAEKPQDKTQQGKPAEQGQPAATLEELFPAGIEQAREASFKAAELDRSDTAFATGDPEGMFETFDSMFGENPRGATDAMWAARQYLESKAPGELAQFSKFVVSEELDKQGIWQGLEQLYSVAQKTGNPEMVSQVNRLATFFNQAYGLGPAHPEVAEASWQNYSSSVGRMMDQNIPAYIQRAFGKEFASVSPADQSELITAAQKIVRDALQSDPELGRALQKLKGAYSVNAGVKTFFDVIDRKSRSLVSRAVRNLRTEYGDLFKAVPAKKPIGQPKTVPATPAPRSMAEAMSKGMSMSEILKTVQSPTEQAESDNLLGRAEANRMSDSDILSSNRRVDLTRSEKKTHKVSKADVLRSRVPFSAILDDGLEVTE